MPDPITIPLTQSQIEGFEVAELACQATAHAVQLDLAAAQQMRAEAKQLELDARGAQQKADGAVERIAKAILAEHGHDPELTATALVNVSTRDRRITITFPPTAPTPPAEPTATPLPDRVAEVAPPAPPEVIPG